MDTSLSSFFDGLFEFQIKQTFGVGTEGQSSLSKFIRHTGYETRLEYNINDSGNSL